jgi:hypothetical protein
MIEKMKDNISVTHMGQEKFEKELRHVKHEFKMERQKYNGFLERDHEKLRHVQ